MKVINEDVPGQMVPVYVPEEIYNWMEALRLKMNLESGLDVSMGLFILTATLDSLTTNYPDGEMPKYLNGLGPS